MLAGLILRGVAFEFRHTAERTRWIWNAGFTGGSLVAAFTQGVMVGALVEGLPLSDGRYVGGLFGWLSPFAVLCGIGLCVGYALLGACWLVRKCDAEVRDAAYRQIPYLSAALLVFLIVVFVYCVGRRPSGHDAMAADGRICSSSRWPAHLPQSRLPPAFMAVRTRCRFPWWSSFFVAAFGTLAISFWPYMIPFSITIDQAAAPDSSLAFMFWGEGLFVFPLMLLYTAITSPCSEARSMGRRMNNGSKVRTGVSLPR